MIKNKKAPSLKLMRFIVGIFLVISVIVFISLGFVIRYQDMKETYAMAEKTTAYLKAECEKYDNYIRGKGARSLEDLLDNAAGLNKFINSEKLSDPDFLKEFIRTEHMSGIIILDDTLSPIAQADLDDKNSYELWKDTIEQGNIASVLKYPQKTYVDHIAVGNIPYDVAATASTDGKKLIFCYSSAAKPSYDPYELTLKSILTNNTFYKNPYLAITDGTKILSTNSTVIEELGNSQYKYLSTTIDWKDGQFTKFKYQKETYYGVRRVYNDYYVYAVYSSGDVFANCRNLGVFVISLYLIVGIIILVVQRHSDKDSINKMEKQLRIIDAISTSYSSTFLLHLENMELEPIRPSERLREIYEKHKNAYDFLFAVCKDEVDKDYYSTVMHFLDLDTIAERLKGSNFLGNEVKDCHGAWYSVSLIPQKYDENGKLQAVLVATRDVSSAKQAEELSFKDKLTGLHNRNYMEARSKEGVRSDDFPVSLIMADCNYLKRTNDTLGHEYGDLLLQRIANAITDSIPKNCVAMRVGGDEFLILCMQCNNEKAHQIVEDIKKKLKEHSDDKLTLSAAFGVSTTKEKDTFSFEQAYEDADQEMYRDKKASRVERI